MAGGCGRGVPLPGVATRRGSAYRRSGRRKLRRESGDPSGDTPPGGADAGGAFEGRAFLSKSEKMPVLLSAAKDDAGAVELMEWLYSLSTNPGSKIAEYPNGGHGVDMFGAHQDLAVLIVQWYVQ